ncbi:MAG: hypothetical protein RI907_1618 [Pseudomonadota bacterium]|jgi:hypothetical protein
MNWFDNISSDSDQPISAAWLMQGHWRFQPHPYADPQLCRLVVDLAGARVVAAQFLAPGRVSDLESSALEDLTAALHAEGVMQNLTAWGFTACDALPTWAKPSFSEQQIEELERIEGYLIEATDDTIDEVLHLRDEFLRGLGLTDQDVVRAARQPDYGQVGRKGGRRLS